MMADSGLSFDHPGPSNGVVPIFNTKSHFFKQTVPLSHIMRLTPVLANLYEAVYIYVQDQSTYILQCY